MRESEWPANVPTAFETDGFFGSAARIAANVDFTSPSVRTQISLDDWATAKNPLFGGGNADLLSMIPFLVLMLLLYLVGREVILRTRSAKSG